MSWTLSANVASSADDAAIEAAIDASLVSLQNNYEQSDTQLDDLAVAQVQAGKAAAIAIVKSGVLGANIGVNISLSGHANPNHTPQNPVGAYQTVDNITVVVSQSSPPAAIAPVAASIEEPTPTTAPSTTQTPVTDNAPTAALGTQGVEPPAEAPVAGVLDPAVPAVTETPPGQSLA